MKEIMLFIPLSLLASCASHKTTVVQMPRSVLGSTLSAEGMESVRYGENLKAYSVGRYIEPNNSLLMHEAHTVYRVETTAKWNLHPGPTGFISGGPVIGLIDPAHKDGPTTAEVVAEVNRQKAATQALMAQGTRINQTLSQLTTNMAVARQLSEENNQLKSAVNLTSRRLEILEEQFRQKPAEQEFTTSPVSASKGTNDW